MNAIPPAIDGCLRIHANFIPSIHSMYIKWNGMNLTKEETEKKTQTKSIYV